MNKEQEEIQFLGFFGIFHESSQIISSWKKIFTQISVSLIFPLSFIYLAHILLSDYLFSDILQKQYILDHYQMSTRTYHKISDIIYSDWTKFFVFKLCYFILFLVLSLLSTAAVVYTIACIYTGREIDFKKVISVVPKVWKRLIVTFLWSSAIIFFYNLAGATIMVFVVIVIGLLGYETTAIVVLVILFILFFVGLVYISLIWQLASVVSVLEDFYGLKAMMKSRDLIKGKMGISLLVFLVLGVCALGVHLIFEGLVVGRIETPILSRVSFGVLCLSLQTVLMLLGFIVQTIIYFVCKSFHHESIDKSSLSDHLEVYLGEYVPLKSKDVQLERFQV